MSSLLTLHGTLTFPPGRIEAWLDGPLTVEDFDEEREDLGCFFGANDLDAVRAVLDDVADAWPFVRIAVVGHVVSLRAALGDDFWCTWAARLRVLVAAAARVGAVGFLEAEDDGCPAGRLEIRGARVVYDERAVHSDAAGESEMYEILKDVFDRERARMEQRRIGEAAARRKKSVAKPAATTKTRAKSASKAKTPAAKQPAKQKPTTKKAAPKKPASKKSASKKSTAN